MKNDLCFNSVNTLAPIRLFETLKLYTKRTCKETIVVDKNILKDKWLCTSYLFVIFSIVPRVQVFITITDFLTAYRLVPHDKKIQPSSGQ